MDADVLVNLLLELNVLNTQDVDTELRHLAATVSDPRAQKWLMRVARHFLLNIDQLMKQPYRAKAEPRGGWSSKYHYKSTGGWEPGQAPEEPAPEGRNKWWEEKPMAGDPNACHTCGGSGYVKDIRHAETGEPTQTAWIQGVDSPELKRKCPTCNGTGKVSYENHPAFESLARRVVEATRKKKAPAPEPEEPEEPGVYKSRLHEPDVARQIHQNFRAYSTKKAPKSRHYGEAPPASEAPDWAKERESEQELHYFDPIQTRRRELWIRLENVVHFFNYKARELSKADSENPNERAAAENAKMFFRRLETMRTGDIDGFRQVMVQAQDFMYDVKHRPWLYMEDPKLISDSGGYQLLRASMPQTVVQLSKRDTVKGDTPDWCTHTEHHAENYSNQGPLYFVDKEGYPYALIHFESGQAKSAAPNEPEINAEEAREIAPLFLDPKRFPLSKFQSNRYATGLTHLGQAVADLREEHGIR